MTPLDSHLAVADGEVVCRECDEALCGAEENYKLHVPVERSPLAEAGPMVNDPDEYVDDDLEFRRFYCPGCATQLATEVVETDRAPLHDKQLFVD